MARIVRNAKLDTRAARLKLEAGKRHFGSIGETGVAVGYRRNAGTSKGSSWSVRYSVGNNKYKIHTLGDTDDHQDADGEKVLNYAQATKEAKRFLERINGIADIDYTVGNAFADYIEWYELHGNHGKGGKRREDVTTTYNTHIKNTFGSRKLVDVKKETVKLWLDNLAASPAAFRNGHVRENNDQRKRKATANRIFTILKAILNYACFEAHKIDSDAGWRTIRPFRNVDAPRVSWFTTDETRRLINACKPEFRQLVQAALLTGCRYGELIQARVSWFDPENGLLHLPATATKASEARESYLNAEGILHFQRATLGKASDDIIFTRADGSQWSKSSQTRPMKEACANAKIEPSKGFHILRHSYATSLINQGVSIETIAQCIGDKDLRTVRRHYAHLLNATVRKAVIDHLPSIGVESDNVVGIRGG